MNEPRANVTAGLGGALFTDYYELTMAQAYFHEGMDGVASFELFYRALPSSRRFIIAAGLAEALQALAGWRFEEDDLRFLEKQGLYSAAFLNALGRMRFTGHIEAVPEGTPVFAHEPILRVTAPIIQAQLLETLILNTIHLQSMAATKTVRLVQAAAGRPVIDFGARRAHGVDAALQVARASYLAGAAGTSNVMAGRRYGIPLFGTMAHSYIQAHADELEAFAAFAQRYPGTTLLVDTYDTLEGVRRVIALRDLLKERFSVRAIRLDSGDLDGLARVARQTLDAAGLSSVRIFVSNDLDEYSISRLMRDGAPVDGFGVGTRLAVCEDAPSLNMVYKLVAFQGRPVFKLSQEKISYPGRRQVYRVARNGVMERDLLAAEEEQEAGEALLQPVMRNGEILDTQTLDTRHLRTQAMRHIATIPEALHRLSESPPPYPVEISRGLKEKLATLSGRMAGVDDR